MTEVWYTATTIVETPRGRRWRGVVYAARGRSWRVRRTANEDGERLPRGAVTIYTTPLRLHAGDAYEQARSVTIHHNLYHGEDPASNHGSRRCHG